MSPILLLLDEVPDPRRGNALRHDLLDILTIALVGSICGRDSCVDFADFAEDREALFREFLDLENGLPSHDTLGRVFRPLDPEAFASCLGRFAEALGAAGAGVVAIDGKTLRRSFDRAASRSTCRGIATRPGAGRWRRPGRRRFRRMSRRRCSAAATDRATGRRWSRWVCRSPAPA